MERQAVPRVVGKKIRALRKAAGISQDELALNMDMARSFYGRLERGEDYDYHYSCQNCKGAESPSI